jgi:hypothetical protein
VPKNEAPASATRPGLLSTTWSRQEVNMAKYIDLAKAIKMLQRERFYAILVVAGTLGAMWLLPPIITALR